MTPEERVAAIRERWQHIWEGDSRFSSAGDVRFLLTHIERLRAVAEAARSADGIAVDMGDHVDVPLFLWERLQAALRALDGGGAE